MAETTPQARTLSRRLLPVALVAALAGSNGLFLVRERAANDESAQARSDTEAAHRGTGEAVKDVQAKLDTAKRDLAAAEHSLDATAVSLASAKDDATRTESKLASERDDAKKKAAALADKLGEAEAERDRLAKHAAELDDLVKRLADRKLDVRRLAGLDAPPREEAEVVAIDEKRVPPVLVLRTDTLDGLEEGDKLFLVRSPDGKARQTGHAIVESVDRDRGLLAARIGKLDQGEKISVGDKLRTYPP